MKLIKKGAEANLYLHQNGKILTKDRVKKGYRASQLDQKIRKRRTKAEAKLLESAARAGVKVPRVLKIDDYSLDLEFIEGERIKEILNKRSYIGICKKIGNSVARLHKCDIVHGDLTTSNMILKEEEIFFIDFGLGLFSSSVEDKATDLHLLEEAMESTHSEVADEALSIVLGRYEKNYDRAGEVLKRLEDVRSRGRYVKRG